MVNLRRCAVAAGLLCLSHVVARHQRHGDGLPSALAVDKPKGRGLSEKLLDLFGMSSPPMRELIQDERRAAVEHVQLLEPEADALAEVASKVTKAKKNLGDRKHLSSFGAPQSGAGSADDDLLNANGEVKEVPVPVPLPDEMEQPPDDFASQDGPETPKAPCAGEATFDVAAEAATGTALDTLLMMERLLNMTENTTTSFLEVLEDGHRELRRGESVNEELDRRIVALHERARSFAAVLSLLETTDQGSRDELASQSAAIGERLRSLAAPTGDTEEAKAVGLAELARDSDRLDALAEHCHRRASAVKYDTTLSELTAFQQRLALQDEQAADAAAWQRFGSLAARPKRWQLEELCETLSGEAGEVEAISLSLLQSAQAVAGVS